jgi:hypothetical protein
MNKPTVFADLAFIFRGEQVGKRKQDISEEKIP